MTVSLSMTRWRRMTMGMERAAVLAAIMACGLGGCIDNSVSAQDDSCNCSLPDIGWHDAADAGWDSGLDATSDAGADDAGVIDWGLDPDAWVDFPPCDATEIQLPPSGETSVLNVSNTGTIVVYDDVRYGDPLRTDIYLYDLLTCHEYQITNKIWSQHSPAIWSDAVVFCDRPGSNTPESNLVLFDLQTLLFTPLTAPTNGTRLRFNGQYIVYSSWEDTAINGTDLMLWDLVTDDDVLLAEYWQGAENVSISPTHAAWVAWGGPDKDVFFVDLDTKAITQVASTWEPYTAHAATWGDWVLWEDRRHGMSDVYALRISTGEEIRLTDNGVYNGRPTLRGSIACWRTSFYEPTVGWDLVVYDMETQVLRRVTREQHTHYKPGIVDSGWLVYQKQTFPGDYSRNTIHAVDLIAAGILDPTGQHVLPEP